MNINYMYSQDNLEDNYSPSYKLPTTRDLFLTQNVLYRFTQVFFYCYQIDLNWFVFKKTPVRINNLINALGYSGVGVLTLKPCPNRIIS